MKDKFGGINSKNQWQPLPYYKNAVAVSEEKWVFHSPEGTVEIPKAVFKWGEFEKFYDAHQHGSLRIVWMPDASKFFNPMQFADFLDYLEKNAGTYGHPHKLKVEFHQRGLSMLMLFDTFSMPSKDQWYDLYLEQHAELRFMWEQNVTENAYKQLTGRRFLPTDTFGPYREFKIDTGAVFLRRNIGIEIVHRDYTPAGVYFESPDAKPFSPEGLYKLLAKGVVVQVRE